jgi:hypothetical protein
MLLAEERCKTTRNMITGMVRSSTPTRTATETAFVDVLRRCIQAIPSLAAEADLQ